MDPDLFRTKIDQKLAFQRTLTTTLGPFGLPRIGSLCSLMGAVSMVHHYGRDREKFTRSLKCSNGSKTSPRMPPRNFGLKRLVVEGGPWESGPRVV